MVLFLKVVALLFMNYGFIHSDKDAYMNGTGLFMLALLVEFIIQKIEKHYSEKYR